MAETCKLRLVRCPKCENLLPELPDYSVYRCGGCGAVLRAKKVTTVDGSNGLKREDKERIGIVCDEPDSLLGKSKDVIESGEVRLSDNEGINEGDKFSGESGKFVGKGIVSGVENEVNRLSDVKGNVEIVSQKFENDLKKEVSKWVVEDGSFGKNDVSNGNMESKVDKLEPNVDNSNVSRRSSRLFEQKVSDRGEEEQFGRVRRGFERLRFSNLSQVGEGSSKYDLDSDYRRESGRGSKPEYQDPDKEELLKKLDELKEQLTRVQNVNDKPREKSPLEHRMAHVEPYSEPDDYFRNHTLGFNRVSRQFSASNKHLTGSPYLESYCEPYPVLNRPDMNMYNYHGPMQNSNYGPRYEDSFETHMLRRPPPRRIPTHHQYASHEAESFDPHAYNMNLHHLSCSCYQCYDRQIPSSGFGIRAFPHIVNKGVTYHHERHPGFGPHGYNPRVVNAPQISSCEPPPRAKWPAELKRGMGSYSRPRPQRVVLTNGQRYHPIAGGAPFVTCQNCYELLKLPKKVCYKKGEWKMSCGACSSLITFSFEDEKLVSVDTSLKQATTEALVSSNDVVRGNVKRENASFCSEDYANSIYDFQAMDREPISSSTGQGVSSSKSEETHNISVTTSEDEHFSEDLVDGQGVTSTAEPLENGASSSPSPRGSPLQDPVDYGSKYHAVNRCGKGNLSSRSDQERVITGKNTARQNSLKESLATEMDIPLNDYANNGGSQDTSDNVYREEQPKAKKAGDSFLAGIIKKSFRDFSRSNQNLEGGKRNVTVNGHLIPDRSVKKAEKLAGPIYPGQYWYDYRAGFWGLMGGPCLGIIPPYVEEFNYPIPENCAGGNTGVFVNGRELHQKDLDLLSTRGLPPVRGRSYIIEITGRVVDEDTGEELDSLGKLAPTIEKVKHGFGMRPPKPPT